MSDNGDITGYFGGSCGGVTRDFSFESNLRKGTYCVATEMEFNSTSIKKFVLSTYSDSRCNVNECKKKENYG